jgi:hypothetical protein
MKTTFGTIALIAFTSILTACGGGGGGGGSGGTKSSATVISSKAASSTSVEASSAALSSEAPSSVAPSSVAPSSEAQSSTALSSVAPSSIAPSSTAASSLVASSTSSSSTMTSSSAMTSSSLASSSVASSAAAANTGVFVDSAVGGIGYKTTPGNRTGVTNAAGEYAYDAGDSVIFFIGDMEFPAVTAKATVTPLDIANSDDVNNRIVVNIARLLQSLDTDGDASNGISIPTGAVAAATSGVNFDLPVADFAALTSITNLVANSGSSTTSLISQSAAINHLSETLETADPTSLIGSWVAGDGEDGQVVLTFIDSNHYVIMNDEDDEDDDGQDGVEYGTYTWDNNTGVFVAKTIVDTNGQWGLSTSCSVSSIVSLRVKNNGSGLLIQESDESCGENNVDPQFTRVSSNSNGMVGSWFYQSDEQLPTYSLFALTILDDNHYMLAEFATTDSEDYITGGTNGLERGTYNIGANNRVTFAPTTDTNGEWGFSHPNTNETLALDTANDTLFFTSDGEENAPLKRLGKK